jgi:tetratricopeptide (TPR) repeat protein
VTLHGEARRGSPALTRLSGGQALEMLDMQGAWAKVTMPEGQVGYLEMERDSPIAIPPAVVEGLGKRSNVRAGPGKDHDVLATVALRGRYRVLDRHETSTELWYRLDIDGEPGWVWAGLTRKTFSLPAVELVAGLLRMQAGNHHGARSHLERFVEIAGDRESNANLAAAYQMLGAVALRRHDVDPHRALEAFSQAISLTPYDPKAYGLRAMAKVGLSGRIRDALPDVETALDLDYLDGDARSLVRLFGQIVEGEVAPELSHRFFGGERERDMLQALRERYGLPDE